jgi:hypothetical protein
MLPRKMLDRSRFRLRSAVALPLYVLLLVFGWLAAGMAGDHRPG